MSAAKPVVSIVMGSESDWLIMSKATHVLDGLKIPYEVKVGYSAHRLPGILSEYVRSFEGRVFIAGAGMSAALPGVIASQTHLPVIGVPLTSKASPLNGQDALYSIVQMPSGVPVACVSIDGSKNAALLAAQIIALVDPLVRTRLLKYKKDQQQQALEKITHQNLNRSR